MYSARSRKMKARRAILCVICCMAISPLAALAQTAHRATLSLDGTWDVEDSVSADQVPSAYHHTVSVPGLAHSAKPAIADVDQYRPVNCFRTSCGRAGSARQITTSWATRV